MKKINTFLKDCSVKNLSLDSTGKKNKNFLLRSFSYEMDISVFDDICRNKSYSELVNCFINKFLFNKKNKFIFVYSLFTAIVFRVLNLFVFVSFFYGIIFLLNKVSSVEFFVSGTITLILSIVFCLLHLLVFNKLIKISKIKNKEYITKRFIINTTLINIWVWKASKYIYKFFDIYEEKSIKNYSEWKEILEDKMDLFISGMDIFLKCFGVFENKKNIIINKTKKIKRYKITKKTPSPDFSSIIIFIFFLKYGCLLAFLYLFFCAILAIIIYSITNNV